VIVAGKNASAGPVYYFVRGFARIRDQQMQGRTSRARCADNIIRQVTQKFCGRDCQMLDLQAKNKRFREIEGADKCLHCDKELPARKKGLARKYCSNKCRSRATYLRNIKGIPDKRKCMQCKELFTPKTKQGQLCSLECKRQNKRSLERQRYRDKNPGSVIYKTKQFRT